MGLLPGIEVEVEVDRDCWTTPEWLWRIPLLVEGRDAYDLDPCSNAFSTVPAGHVIAPPRCGRTLPWPGSLAWLNPPYSDVKPWFDRACAYRDAGGRVWGVVPHAPHISAWREYGPDLAWSLGRVRFVPPPGVGESSPTQEHDLVLWECGYGTDAYEVDGLVRDATGIAYATWRSSTADVEKKENRRPNGAMEHRPT